MHFIERTRAKYEIRALPKAQIDSLIDVHKDQKDLYFIPSNNPTVKSTNVKLFPHYEGPRGFLAFTLKGLSAEIFKTAKYVHVVKSKAKKILDLTKKISNVGAYEDLFSRLQGHEAVSQEETTRLRAGFGYDLILDAGKDSPEMVVFVDERTSPKPAFDLLQTVFTQKEATPTINLTPEERDLLKAYTPDLGDHTIFRTPMSENKFEENVDKMSDDDIAWHLLTSRNGQELGNLACIRNRLGFKEICLLNLMNKNLSKKTRSQIASYMLSNMGVSFVGGPTLTKYIETLAKTGELTADILKGAKESKLIDEIYYGEISDPEELRKIDIKEYGYQLAHNPHTPPDVLQKIVAHENKQGEKGPKKGLPISSGEVAWWGYHPANGGTAGKDFTFNFSKTLQNPNYPINELINVFKKYFLSYGKGAVNSMLKVLWDRPDLPKATARVLIEDFKSDFPVPPACFDEKEFLEYWNKKGDLGDWSYVSELVHHPHIPVEVLKELLEDKKVDERLKTEIYKKLMEKGAFSEKEIVAKVKKDLKFEGPTDLLKHFGLTSWLGTKGKESLKFTAVKPQELEALKKEMDATTVHDDFTFEVVAAYTVDKQVHKNYPKQAKAINNVKHGLYHGTSMANAAGILATGINTAANSRTGQMFGNGFYLASSASKAAQYASDNFSKSGLGIVFKMDAALGKHVEWKYGRPEHDNYYSNPDPATKNAMKKRGKEIGVEEYEIPRWHLKYDSVHAKKGMSLNHDEYVIKEGDQININEIIIVHKVPK